jgi:hypothetical protein
MSTSELAAAALEIIERVEAEKASLSTQEIKLDDTNEVKFPDYPYTFEALGERILVSIDVFKSGYECKDCKGTGVLVSRCLCTSTDRPGFKYCKDTLDRMEVTGTVRENRATVKCSSCNGDPKSVEKELTCPTCKGKKALLHFPDDSKNMPTTGIVVSMGSVAKERAPFTIGDRILFGPHTGTAIPTKAGLMFKYMDWNQAALRIRGANELGAFDFIIQKEEN